jgi:NDP-sugar pyrophosphorylase family protein
MKAMILAAGLGTRLRPLTDVCPKPLVPVANRPVIAGTIAYLKAHGIESVIVNTHHHARRMSAFFRSGVDLGLPVELRHEPSILGTGGGLRNVADFWGRETLLAINGDILTDIDLGDALTFHRASGAPATLVLHDYPSFNQVLLHETGRIREIGSRPEPGRLAFTGIHFLEPEVRDWIPPEGYADIVGSYRRLIASGEGIAGWVAERAYWRDIGTLSSYLQANRERSPEPVLLGPGCEVAPSARFSDWAVAGGGCRLEAGASVVRSVLWEGVRVGRGVRVVDSVVTSGRVVERDLAGEAL